MLKRLLCLFVALSLVVSCATRTAVEPVPSAPAAGISAAPGTPGAERVRVGPSEEAMLAGGVATGAVLALIAVAVIAGTASFLFVSDP